MSIKYELIKSIGFKLDPVQIDSLEEKVKQLDYQFESDQRRDCLAPFIEGIETFICHFKEFIFTKDSNKTQKKSKNNKLENKRCLSDIYIKYQWLRTYTKSNFFFWSEGKQVKNKYFIREIPYLKDILDECIKEWEEIIQCLKSDLKAPKKNLKRRSKTALLISRFSKKQVFQFIEDFVHYSSPKKDEKEKDHLKDLLEEIKASLIKIQKIYLPLQSSGLVFAKASFNYYTIDKEPKNYDQEKKECEKKINNPSLLGVKLKEFSIKSEFHQMIKKWMDNNEDPEAGEFLEKNQLNGESDLKNLSLKIAYSLIKLYKGQAKKLFEEDVSRDLNYKDIKAKHPLFINAQQREKEEHEKFKKRTKEIERINREIEKIKKAESSKERVKKLRKKRANLKQQRGKFFQKSAKRYIDVCKNYEKIAKNLGQLSSQIKGIQREKEESQLLNYWAFILEKQGGYELLLIHRGKRQDAKNLIESGQEGSHKLYQFYSLTLRALDKLCFGFQGTKDTDFLKEIKTELPEYRGIAGKFSFKNSSTDGIDEKELIGFYQKVLKSAYAKKVLKIDIFYGLDNVLNTKFQFLNEFQSALERVCYLKKTHLINDEVKVGLLKMDKSCLFKITSYDLSLYDKNIKVRHHTNLWKEFWSEKNERNHYPVRLNPEVSVFWRESQDYRFTEGKYTSVKRNRFLKSQWNLKTSLTLNATTEKVGLSFKKPEELAKEIIKFNKRFYKNMNDKRIFYYGLDSGLKELATLCVMKDSKFDNGLSSFPIEIYSLKEEMYDHRGGATNHHTASRNPSYFIDLFMKNENPTLDLTTAKLINGKIVENGDIFTYLKLKELSAKRRLFRYKSEIADNKIYFSESNKSFYVKIINREQEEKSPIYYFRDGFKKILKKEDIQENLQNYLNDLNKNKIKVPPLINHLRGAVAANISGILAFLYKQNPGLIVLETNQKARNKTEDESIAVQLQWALYKKFQMKGLVPPCLKDEDFLLKNKSMDRQKNNKRKSKDQMDQIRHFGLIHFVKHDDTSRMCPECGRKSEDSPEFKNRKKNGWFKCEGCDFNTKKLSKKLWFLNTPDKLAAFNICKKGLELKKELLAEYHNF